MKAILSRGYVTESGSAAAASLAVYTLAMTASPTRGVMMSHSVRVLTVASTTTASVGSSCFCVHSEERLMSTLRRGKTISI